MALQIDEYQEKAHSTAFYKGMYKKDWTYPVTGLASEAGEVCGKFAKAVRDSNGYISEARKEDIIKELGDVCWFVAEIATVFDVKLSEVMEKNLEKLEDRKKRGVLSGSGDNR